jgi:hypothetical protein
MLENCVTFYLELFKDCDLNTEARGRVKAYVWHLIDVTFV